MPPIQYIVEGGQRLSGTIEPSGNKNSALPIIAAALLTEHPVTLQNVPRIRDTETLVELIRSVGASAEWKARNTLDIHAKEVRAADLDPELCARIRASILLAGPLLARCGQVARARPGDARRHQLFDPARPYRGWLPDRARRRDALAAAHRKGRRRASALDPDGV